MGKRIKRTSRNKHESYDSDVISIDSTQKFTITSTSQTIDASGLAGLESLEQLDIRGCEKVTSIDLSALDGNETLRIIRIEDNYPVQSIVLPSGCTRLEEVIITNNNVRDLADIEPMNLPKDPRENILRHYELVQEVVKKRLAALPKTLDLSKLDGSPRLRVFKISNNMYDYNGVILPERCPNLEVVILDETRVKEWRLVDCPRLRLIRLKCKWNKDRFIDIEEDTLTFWKAQPKPPIIDVTIMVETPIEFMVNNFTDVLESIDNRLVERVRDVGRPHGRVRGVLNECNRLLMSYGVILRSSYGPVKDRTLLGDYQDSDYISRHYYF